MNNTEQTRQPSYPIFPSILAFDFARLGEQVREVEAAGAAALHFDIMDGHFVPNLTFGAPVVAAVRRITDLPIYAHIMAFNPETLIGPLAKAGVTGITLHPESTPHIHRWLQAVEDAGLEVGLALNPGSSLTLVEPVIEMVRSILVMSVDPGFGGQAFQPESIRRVAQLAHMAACHGVAPAIEVDGGIDVDNIRLLADAGMTGAVVGSALFAEGDPAAKLRRLQEAAIG